MRIPEDYSRYMSMHRECNQRLLARIESFTSPLDLEISSDPVAVRLRKMVYAVQVEVHRMKAFVRLKPLGDRVLWGYLKPRHRIGEKISEHFARRNPGIIVVLGNSIESWTAFFWQGRMMRDQGAGLNETLDRLRAALKISEKEAETDPDGRDAEGLDVDDIWQTYYDSQFCPERKNLQTFRQRMPKRDQEAAGLRLVQRKKEMTLEDFCQKKWSSGENDQHNKRS